MSPTRRPGGLGRGLGALIPTAPPEPDTLSADPVSPDTSSPDTPAAAAPGTAAPGTDAAPTPPGATPMTPADAAGPVGTGSSRGPAVDPGVASFAELPVGVIRPNPQQPRTVFDPDLLAELVASIGVVGVLQPVVVRPVPDGYELVMGERRWRASQLAGLATIPAIIRHTADADLLRDALLENLHRAELNPLEEAHAYAQLLEDFGATHDELAARIGCSRPQITNTLRLLQLPPPVARRVAAGVLSAGHARALLGLADAAAMEALATRIVAEGLSVRATEEIVAVRGPARSRGGRPPRSRAEQPDWAARSQQHWADALDTRVTVTAAGKGGRGTLVVEFADAEDLARITAVLAARSGSTPSLSA